MAPTQDALYADLDLELSWSERDLPERVRTKHVHRLHPYLGKFIPQLVEVLLDRYFRPGQHVLDPFAGSGTTLVQALETGLDATGVDVAAFNCLLMQVKTRDVQPVRPRAGISELRTRAPGETSSERADPRYVRRWYAPQAARELLGFRGPHRASTSTRTSCVSSSRARLARRVGRRTSTSTSRVTPQLEPYWCYKHAANAGRSRRRRSSCAATRSTRSRGSRSSRRVRARGRAATVLHGDVRELPLGPLRRRPHLAAVSRADRLSRTAPVRVRAARARRPPRARARCGGGRNIARGARRVLGRNRRRAARTRRSPCRASARS